MRNEKVLPVGAVCDSCNNYLGKLDETLASHPLIALGIQGMKLRGKSGKLRKRVGNVSRDQVPDAVTVPIAPPEHERGPDGRTMIVTPLVPESFDELPFRRALHHVALNVVALKEGPEAALERDFDAVRKYIRKPKRGEAWPFGELMFGGAFYSDVDIVVSSFGDSLVVSMRLLGGVFYVDLLGRADFTSFIENEQRTFPMIRYVGPEVRLPRQEPMEKTGRRWRVTIPDER